LLKVAAPTHIGVLDDEARPIAEGIANIGDALHAPYITIDISMGHRKGALDRGIVTRVINQFRNLIAGDGATIETLSASVSDVEGADMIDFLEEYLVVRARLEFPNNNPDGHYELRKVLLEHIQCKSRIRQRYIHSVNRWQSNGRDIGALPLP
jgi:hypothetical protein